MAAKIADGSSGFLEADEHPGAQQQGFGMSGGFLDVCVEGRAGPGPVVGDEIVITIADHAAPFYPEHAPEPLLDVPASERRPGGLGWHLIRQSVDHFRYESDSAGNRLTLVKSARARQEG